MTEDGRDGLSRSNGDSMVTGLWRSMTVLEGENKVLP